MSNLKQFTMQFKFRFSVMVAKGHWWHSPEYNSFEECIAAQSEKVKEVIRVTRWHHVQTTLSWDSVSTPVQGTQNAQGQQ